MNEEVVTKPPSILMRLARQYASEEANVEVVEERLKDAKRKRSTAEKKLTEEMITQRVKAFKTEDVGGFRTQAVVYPNIRDREALNAYVKKRKTLAWLFTMSINGAKLKSFVKELMEQGKPIPPGIEPYVTTEIRRYK